MKKVVIIGAGASGLNAALKLKEKYGIENVLVLEARTRVGGRTASEAMATDCVTSDPENPALKHIVDSGGQWVGPHQLRVNELISRFNLTLHEQWDQGKHVLQDGGKVHEYTGLIGDLDVGATELASLWERLDAMAAEIDSVAEPWKSCGASQLDAVTVKAWLQKNVFEATTRRLVEWFVLVCLTTETHTVSMLYFLTWLKSGGLYAALVNIRGGAQNHTVVGGMNQLSENMARVLGPDVVQLGSVVKKVVRHADSVVISYERNGVMEHVKASRVVMTLSLPLAGKIEFVPGPSFERRGLISESAMGRVRKIVMAFKSPWWRDRGFSGEFISDKGPLSLGYDRSYLPDKFYGLVLFCAGDCAVEWDKKSRDERLEDCLAQLSHLFSFDCRNEFLAYSEHDWAHEEFSGGCYFAHVKPGAIMRWKKALAAPVQGRIFYAGTETAHEHIGYIEGALESGERVAREIAQFEGFQKAKL